MDPWLRAVRLALLFVFPALLYADPAPFDLAGPRLQVRVVHDGKTLPIAEVPNLTVGDQISIRAELPPGQSVHYLLVAAFLRGATNPPPESWFYSSETWNRKDAGGLKITVPDNAQQVLVFLAPETGGDFKTLVGAVRGRPGAFVRASQDLNQATLDRARLKVYLTAIRKISQGSPEKLKEASPLLARSLSIKFNPDCLEKIPELQAPCLMQGQDSLILNDGHSTSVVEALTSPTPSDLVTQLSATPQAGFGYYSPYIASVVDIARILDSFHTAQYQYIPALGTEQDDQLSLELNTPPSFQNPKSVLVVALPAVESPQMPPLRPVDPKGVYCAEKTELVLPAEGAPLAFATGYAHDMVLRLKGKDGKVVDLPVKADAEQGGFVANTTGLSPTNFGDVLDGSLHGYWGFDAYDGPEFKLENAHPQHWQLAFSDQSALIAGQNDTVHLETENAACVDNIQLETPSGQTVKTEWKPTGPNQVVVTLPLKKAKPGVMKVLVKQYGSKEPDTVLLQAYAAAGHLDGFTLHAGDRGGVLKGTQLDSVKDLTLNGVQFVPASAGGGDGNELELVAADAKSVETLKAGESATAKVELKDGRVLNLETTVAAPRPSVKLIGKSVEAPAASNIQLGGADEVPLAAQLTFSIHAEQPAEFTGDEKVEVATEQGAHLATLTTANGLTLVDSHVALATVDTGKAFAESASGPLKFRLLEDGVASDWQPLATLVRLPALRDLQCPADATQPCTLSGARLFLVDAVGTDAQFDHATSVPEGFPGKTLSVPRPVDGQLYLKLHDDPSVVNTVAFPGAVSAPPPVVAASGTPAGAATPAQKSKNQAPTATTEEEGAASTEAGAEKTAATIAASQGVATAVPAKDASAATKAQAKAQGKAANGAAALKPAKPSPDGPVQN